ncbi:MAG: hypothetical protein PHQ65_03710 [Bacteroidales bacterium]|nr:hypothetical protein [Bacteroidales bacterium]MDD3664348.1 hypothetical protein [Bacteroidales bacterium]
MEGKKLKPVLFPENRKVSAVLQKGDRQRIATETGYTIISIRDMLQGYRRMPDKVKQAIVNLMNQRRELNATLEQIVEQA